MLMNEIPTIRARVGDFVIKAPTVICLLRIVTDADNCRHFGMIGELNRNLIADSHVSIATAATWPQVEIGHGSASSSSEKRVMIPTVAAYAGCVITLFGFLVLFRPLPTIGLPGRWHGAALAAIGVLVTLGALLVPATETNVVAARTRLDEFMPRYQFTERHSIHVNVPPAVAFQAVERVTADEIRFFRTLTWIRRFGRKGAESILTSPEHMPLLEVATRTTFMQLALEPPAELVVGTLVAKPAPESERPRTPAEFVALALPGFAKAAMNFRVEPDGHGGSFISTETRVFATDDAARRRFGVYWRIILPGSALIRRGWLAAIERRTDTL